MQLRALDLFCGAGGATRGLQQAGFHVTGVDIAPQPRYVGDAFVQADALTFPLDGFDFVWASPPCQRFSQQSRCRKGLASEYPDLIAPIRDRLVKQGGAWTIENVECSPLISPVKLCGAMFGMRTYRHRLFESSFRVAVTLHPRHTVKGSRAGHYEPGTFISVCGNCAPFTLAKRAMGIDWMAREELAEAIPPAYARYIGLQAAWFIHHCL